MRLRIRLSWFFMRLGRFVTSLSLMVMRPDDLLEFSRQKYATDQIVEYWGSDDMLAGGLTPLEEMLVKETGLSGGKVLVLGMGGGREAISLAQKGFTVTGVDYIPAAVAKAKENAARHGVHLEAWEGDYVAMDQPPTGFDLVVLTSEMYSNIPSRAKRLGFLHKIFAALQPGGWFICGFWWDPVLPFSPRVDRLRKLFAYLSFGNTSYEPGDMLGALEFIHAFTSKAELTSEFAAGGFALTHLYVPHEQGDIHGIALLHKTA
jgi:SAM-dependent methyltransferase